MATYAVHLPKRRANPNRPSAFTVNRDSWQASYRRWFVAGNGGLHDVSRGILAPVTISGTPASSSLYAGSSFGLVARTENNGSSTIQRCFTSPSPCPLDGLTALTISYWVRPLTFAGYVGAFWGQGTGNSCFLETDRPAGTTGPYWRGGSDLRNAFTEVLTANEWQLATWTANATSTTYYRNGVLAQTSANGCGTITAAGAGESFYLGGQPSGTGASTIAIDAEFADFRVYPFLASAAQVWELYDPSTRWDLYWVPGRRVFFDVGAAFDAALFPYPHVDDFARRPDAMIPSGRIA